MVEPAATIVFNTLLQGRSTLHPSSVYSVSRVVSRSLSPGFFNPQPRRVKGKERMPDPPHPDILSVYSARCKEWSCRSRISVWCSADAKSAEEGETRRAPRRARKTSLPRHRGLPPPLMHRGQARHASHTSDRPDSDPPSSSADSPTLEPPTEALANGSLELSDAPVEEEDGEGHPDPAPSDPPLPDTISETDSPPEETQSNEPLYVDDTESSPSSPPPPPRDSRSLSADVEYLQRLLAEPHHQFQLEKTWHAYEVIQTYDGLSLLTEEDFLMLADKLLHVVELRSQTDELEELHKWGKRIRRLLEEIGPLNVPAQDTAMYSLRARALALEGELDKSLDTLRSVPSDYEDFHITLRVYESILVSTWRHFDRLRALEFLILRWKAVGPHLLTENSRVYAGTHLAAAGASLRHTAFAIISGISLPALVLADKRQEWDQQKLKQLGELMLESFFRAKLPMESVDILREMERQGLKPAFHLPLQLARALARENLYDDAHAIFSSLEHEREAREYLFTGLYLHAHEGKTEEAEEYFDRITEAGWQNSKDVLQLMYAYAVHGKTKKTLEIFQEFFPEDENGVPTNSPLIDHFTVGIFAHAQRGELATTGVWLELMHRCGMQPDNYVYTTILKSFAMRGELGPIATVLDQMRAAGCPPDLVTYTTVMTLLAHRKDPASTEAIYARAVKDGIVPDSMMVSVLMNAHIEAGSWKGVIRAFDFIASSQHLRFRIGIYNILLKAYIYIGAPFRTVSRIFNRLERLRIRPDAYTFSLLVQSACDARKMDTAMKIFEEMQRFARVWGSNRHITTWTMTILMSGFLRQGDNDSAMAMYEDMKARGLEPNAVTYGVIINAYGREGTADSFKLAEDFIKDLTTQDSEMRTWETPPHGRLAARDYLYLPLLRSYASRHEPEEVERVFEDMLKDGGEPTLSILSTLLDAYARVRDVDSVLKLWPQIFSLGVKYSTIPFFEADSQGQANAKMHTFVLCLPLSIYIRTLSNAGLHDEIAAVWKTFQGHGFSFSSDNWNELAKALLAAGEPERCFEVLEKVFLPYHRRSDLLRDERDPHPDSPLSLLNIEHTDGLPLEKPLVGKARREASKWGRFHRKAHDMFEDENYVHDLAYHLHVLHRISAVWNTWLPRHDVLRRLFEVLLRLRAGYPADAETRDADELSTDPDQLEQRRQAAAERLSNIYQMYPDAVLSVDGFERRERRRLGRWFTKMYPWADR